MRTKLLLSILAAMAVVVTACTAASQTAGGLDSTTSVPDDEPGFGFDDAVADLEASGFNGVLAVADGSDTRIQGIGTADGSADVPIDGRTVFDVGSITKQFTGAAILRLQMDGLLSVEDPLSSYFDDLPGDKADITLHQLLTHTAGFPDAIGDDYEKINRDEFVGLAASTPLNNPPGSTYEYSNVGYSLLAAVIEVATGDSYEVYLESALFAPAEMHDTGYVLPDWSDGAVAVGYVDDRALGKPNEQPWADDGPYWHLRGNGGVLSTAEDMLLWHEALLGDEVLDDDARAQLYEPYVAEDPGETSFYGYGWVIVPLSDDSTLITHNGGNGVFFADFLRFVDDGLTIFLATNRAEPQFESVGVELAATTFGLDSLGDVDGSQAGGSDCLSFDRGDFDDLEPIADPPDSPAAEVAARWFTLVDSPPAEGDDGAMRAFVEEFVDPELVPGMSTDDLVDSGIDLQAELAELDVEEIVALDDAVFVARFLDESGTEVFVSASFSSEDPPRLRCVDVNV